MADTTVNVRPPLWLPILVVLIGGAFYLHGKEIEARGKKPDPVTISVSANAKVSASPDVASLSFGVQTGRQPTAKAAIEKIQKNMSSILEAVKKAGVDEKDISTESFWLSPAYDYTTNGQIPRGYEASQSLRVKVRDLDKVGDVLTAATSAGANQAGSVSFDIDEPDAIQAQAREMAIEKAKAKADVLAQSLGMHVVKITGFTEGGAYTPVPMMMSRDAYGVAGGGGDMAMMEKSVELPAGQQEVSSTVTITYELK